MPKVLGVSAYYLCIWLLHVCVYYNLFPDDPCIAQSPNKCRSSSFFAHAVEFHNNASVNDNPITRSERHDLNRHFTKFTLNSTEDMTRFFNGTYIERLGGSWDVKNR